MQKNIFSILILNYFVFLLLFQTGYAEESSTGFPFTGIINAKDTNLRAGSNLNYEVVSQLQKGDIVYVHSEWMEWYKVKCPENVLLWVSDGFIDSGLVTANKLNVRSGPDLKFNVICQLMKGDKVDVVKKSEDGKWIAIPPPDNAFLWINKQFVDKKGDSNIFEEHLSRRNEVKRLLKEQEDKYLNAMKNEATNPLLYDELILGFDDIAKRYSDFTEEAAMASRRSEQLRAMKKRYEEKLAAQMKKEADARTASGTESLTETDKLTKSSEATTIVKKTETIEDEKSFQPRYLTAKGSVSSSELVGGMKVYKVIEDKKIICIIKSKNIDLNQYVGKRAQIWGNEEYSAQWNKPLIEVNRIKLIK